MFLMLQQIVPEGGFSTDYIKGKGTRSLKSFKTLDLKKVREEEIHLLDDEPQYMLSKHQLD